MSLMDCPTYGTVECAAGVCFICGGQGDEEPLRCPPADEVIQVDCILGWESPPRSDNLDVLGLLPERRPTTLTTMTVRKPKQDVRKVEASAHVALDALHARICGCDDPGKLGYCSFDEFAALDPAKGKA